MWESLRNPHFHARKPGPTIPGPPVGWRVTVRKWSLCRQDKNGAAEGAGARATYNRAGIDVITSRRAALHLQLDASVIICADHTSHLRCPSSHWGPGTSASWPEPGAPPRPPSPPELVAETGLGQDGHSLTGQKVRVAVLFDVALPLGRGAGVGLCLVGTQGLPLLGQAVPVPQMVLHVRLRGQHCLAPAHTLGPASPAIRSLPPLWARTPS